MSTGRVLCPLAKQMGSNDHTSSFSGHDLPRKFNRWQSSVALEQKAAVAHDVRERQRRSRLRPRSGLLGGIFITIILVVPSSPALLILADTTAFFMFVEAPVFFERICESRQRFAHLGSRCCHQLQRTRGRARAIKSTPEGFSGGERGW